MTIDLRSRNFQIELQNPSGGNALNVSSVVKSFTVSNSQLDESGLILATGTLTLHAFPLTPLSESLNPKLNPSRFARKCRVSVQIGDESGNLVTHPRGLLRILKTPKVPSRTNPEIQIQVGCLLSLQDYRQPASDDSGVIPGEPKTRTEIINALAALAKCPDLEDAITAFPIDYPLPRLNGSYVQQMGTIAFAAGYCLWIDNQERLRAKKIPQKPNPVITLRVGRDDNIYEPLEGSETPCEIIYCSCTYPKCLPTLNPPESLSISRDDKYSPSDITIQRWLGMGTTAPYSYRRSRRPKGLVLPDAFPDSPFLTNAEQEYSIDLFEDTERGFLIRRQQLVYQPIGAVMPAFYPGSLSKVLASKTETYYHYEEDVPVTITTYVYQPQGVIDPTNTALESRALPGLAEYSQERYRKVNNGWTKTTTFRSYKVGDSSPSSGSTFSSAGNNQPAAPEQRQQPYYLEDTQVSGKAKYKEIGGSFDERKRTFEVQTASTKAQLDFLSKLIGQRVWGQVNGASFGLDLRDEFNGDDYEPLQCVDWVEIDDATGNYIKSRYLVVGEAFALSQRQCAMAADGLYLGKIIRRRTGGSPTPPTSPTEPPEGDEVEYLDTPYEPVEESAAVFALIGGFTVLPYALEPTSETLEGGNFALVGQLVEQEPLSGSFALVGSFTEGGEGGLTLIHQWTLDTSAWEDSIGTSHLTEAYGPGTVANVPGAVNNCADFGGLYDGGYLETTDSNLPDVFRGHWRLTFKIYFSDTPGLRGIAESRGQWQLYHNGGDYPPELILSIYTTGAGLGIISSVSIEAETWYDITIEVSGSDVSLTVGTTTDTGTLDGTIPDPIDIGFRLGWTDGVGKMTSGRIDEVELRWEP